MPCDGLEQTRLEILHRLYLAALDGALTTAPLSPATQRILDVGTGPGEWASDMAEQFPDAEIVAVDLAVWELPTREVDDDDSDDSLDELDDPKANIIWEIDDLEPYEDGSNHSPVSLPSPPPNARDAVSQTTADIEALAIDQGYASGSTTGGGKSPSASASSSELLSEVLAVDDGWNFSSPFDFIHMRDLKGAFRDWHAVYREAYASLAPGGLLEVVDLMPDFGPSPDPSAFETLISATIAAAEQAQRPLSLAHLDPAFFAEAGFTDVKRTEVEVPMGPWPDDERRAVMGKMCLVCCAEGLEAACLRLLTRVAGWSAERVRGVAGRAKEEILEGMHGSVVTRLWFVTARKARKRGR